MPKSSISPDSKQALSPQFLSVAEVGIILNVSPKTVRAWIADGKLPAFHVGIGTGVTRIRLRDLEHFIDTNMRSKAPGNFDPADETENEPNDGK